MTAFNWLRRLHLQHSLDTGAPIGRFHAVNNECVRLRGSTSLSTWQAPRALPLSASQIPIIVNPWFSLTGPTGALPFAFTELLGKVREREPTALADFLDIFNHRAQSLLYRALCKYLPTACGQPHTAIDSLKSALCGVYIAPHYVCSDEQRDCIAKIMSGAVYFSSASRSVMGLVQLLQRQFHVCVRVREFCGRRERIDEVAWSRIGKRLGCNQVLGVSALAGTRARVLDARLCVEVMAESSADFTHLQGDTSVLPAIRRLAQAYAGADVEIEIRVVTLASLLPTARLARGGQNAGAIKMGYGIVQRARAGDVTTLAVNP